MDGIPGSERIIGALARLVCQADAELVGTGALIEKAFEAGGTDLSPWDSSQCSSRAPRDVRRSNHVRRIGV